MIKVKRLLLLLVVFIAAAFPLHVKGETIYMIPSGGSCQGLPTGPDIRCLTMQEYLSSPSSSSTIVFKLQPGNHTLNDQERLIFGDIDNVTMIASSEAVLDCSRNNGHHIIRFNNVHYVEFQQTTMIDCQCYVEADEVIVQGGSWRGTSATRSAIHLESVSNAAISNWTCSDYCCGLGKCLSLTRSTLHLSDSFFNDNGRISGDEMTLTIERCSFDNHREGVFYTTGSTTLTITNSSFSDNRAGDGGGGVLQHFDGRSDIIVSGCNFTNNKALQIGNSAARGGVIYYRNGGGVLTLTDNNFISNVAVNGGGAIHMVRCGHSTVTNNNFMHNEAFSDHGGAIHADQCNSLTVSSSHFNNNSATVIVSGASARGGAIYSSVGDIVLIASEFTSNVALTEGGGVSVRGDGSLLSVEQTTFFNNTAVEGGGGAIHYSGQYESVTITDSDFSYNTAQHCGIIDIDGFFHTAINFTSSSFTYNRALRNVSDGDSTCIRNATVFIVNSTLSHNTATENAGVFSIDGGIVTIAGSSFINNSAAGDGGVMYTYYYPVVYYIISSTFSENTAGDDGGVLFVGRADSVVRIERSVFTNNNAVDRGGIVSIAVSRLTINETNLIGNTADVGGSISACSSEIMIQNVEDLQMQQEGSSCIHYGGDINRHDLSSNQMLNNYGSLETISPPLSWQCDSFSIMSVSTANSSCLVEVTGIPCITLREYINNPSVASNIYMELEPGSHKIITGLRFEVFNVANFTIVSNDATLDCSESLNHEHINIKDIGYFYVGSLTIIDCQSNFQRIEEFVLEGGLSRGVSTTRPAFALQNVMNAAFRNWTCSHYDSTAHGRCILATSSSSVIVSDSTFTNNRANTGGVISVTTQSSLIVERCTFENNRAQDAAGGIYVIEGATTTISCSTFSNNVAEGSTNNRAGAIYGSRTTVNIRGCSFHYNTAQRDGGVLYSDGATFNVDGCDFISNSAASQGGAVYIRGGRTNLNNCTFNNNNATNGGGAAFVQGGTLELNGINLINNTATSRGADVIHVCGGGRLLGDEDLQSQTESSCTLYSGNVNLYSTDYEFYCPKLSENFTSVVGPQFIAECALLTLVPTTNGPLVTDQTTDRLTTESNTTTDQTTASSTNSPGVTNQATTDGLPTESNTTSDQTTAPATDSPSTTSPAEIPMKFSPTVLDSCPTVTKVEEIHQNIINLLENTSGNNK